MVNNISKAYKSNEAFPVSPQTSKTTKAKKSEAVPSPGALNHAARLSSELRDKVEISAEAREISATKTEFGEEKIPNDVTDSIGNGWYASGYAFAMDTIKG